LNAWPSNVPVAAARAFAARVVIAVNLNANLFGRGTTIADHGSDSDDEVSHETKPDRRGLRGLYGAEQLVKRQFLGEPGRPDVSTVMVEGFNINAGSHYPGPACRRSAGRLCQSPSWPPRPLRVHRADEAIALGAEATKKALEQLGEAVRALGWSESGEVGRRPNARYAKPRRFGSHCN
jgi:NTE family protein